MDSCLAYIQVSRNRWLEYSNPVDVIQANTISQVLPALDRVEKSVDSGLYSVGFLSYESASAFDSALTTSAPDKTPLLWFALFNEPNEISAPPTPKKSYSTGDWQSNVSETEYLNAIKRTKEYIKEGDTYQVNYSQRLTTEFKGDSYSFFYDIMEAQQGRNCTFIETDDFSICSASPELFFALDGSALKSCPMKGTSQRGLTSEQDKLAIEALHTSEKNRAENIMIVDMIRNDMGRVAESGSVHVTDQFAVERYPTVLQMTSTVRSVSDATISDIMKAMFPCASITGAPKVRTMELISELESTPRGIYTGAIGCMAPDRKALFNVGIRTVVIDKATSTAQYGVGGGIVWDSIGEQEHSECIDKAKVLTTRVPDFRLLETILWTSVDGYLLIDEHITRISNSAEYFGFDLNKELLTSKLTELPESMTGSRNRVRLLVSKSGEIEFQCMELHNAEPKDAFKLGLAANPVDSSDPFLYHKTTNRKVYEDAKASCPDCDDVIMYNENGEVTESTIANIVVLTDGRKITPSLECGLLPGTMRESLLSLGEIEEGIISIEQLRSSDQIWLINSVRGWVPAVMA